MRYIFDDKPLEALLQLSANPYPGRFIVIGLNPQGHVTIVYGIMGRSENSRNRVFRQDGPLVYTKAADPSKVEDPSLIIYNAMGMKEHKTGTLHVVSNGVQTDALLDTAGTTYDMSWCMRSLKHEPDPANTPRISAAYDTDAKLITIHIVRRGHAGGNMHAFWEHGLDTIPAGNGYFISTYEGDGNPLPAFKGEPVLMPIGETVEHTLNLYWNKINADNKISLAVRTISAPDDFETVIANKYPEVS